MGTRKRELFLLLALCALVYCEPINKTRKNTDNDLYQYDDDYDTADGVLFSEEKPCPRDCICTVSQGYRIAKCSRLEIGTQIFGDDVTDLVIENADSRFPIKLDDLIFKKLGLHKISSVKIVNSTIDFVSVKAFNGLSELYAVNLSGNKLKELHPETFANNKKLFLLTLSNNPLKFPAKGSNDYFLNASAVQELDVSNCNMQHITANTFKNMSGLMYLNVAGNHLSKIDPDAFRNLLDLEELDFSDNNIKSLPDDIFSANTELATVHIQMNPIDTVYGLQIPDLLTLNAGQTNIKFVGPSMFNGMKYIANLNLSGNGIEKIHNQAFHKLIELNYLDLSYNNLNFISEVLIKENVELEIFKISNNPLLKHLPVKGFECTADQFNIYLFDASNCGLEEIYDSSLNTLGALSQINLSGNRIKTISPQVFASCPKLVEINLSYNLLTTLDNKMFAKNKELGKLNLQGNPLKVISFELFASTPSLTWLDISHADLTALWNRKKNRPSNLLNNLGYVNVSFNRINEVKKQDIETFHKLRTLDISNNPLVCSRAFEDLMTYVNNKSISPTTTSMSIANLARDIKEDSGTYSWEFLAKKICGARGVSGTTVSDEEIWERIDKDAEGNFDLKDTLDDAKVADDNGLNIDQIKKIGDDDVEDDADKDDDDDDKYFDKDDKDAKVADDNGLNIDQIKKIGDDIKDNADKNDDDKYFDKDDKDAKVADDNGLNINQIKKIGDDDVEDDADNDDRYFDKDDDDDDKDFDKDDREDDDDLYDDDMDLKVKLIENPKNTKIPEVKPIKKDDVEIDVKLLDSDDIYNVLTEQEEYARASVLGSRHGRYDYVWPMLIAILLTVVVMMVIARVIMLVCRRNRQVRYNSAIIAAMTASTRTKKDCGLIYQPLSEEFNAPATPKFNRYEPLPTVTVQAANMSYESSPFHHNKIVPEAV